MSESDREASIKSMAWPTRGCCTMGGNKNVRYDMGGLAGMKECNMKSGCVRSDGNICFRSWLRDSKYGDCLVSFWPSAVLLFRPADVR